MLQKLLTYFFLICVSFGFSQTVVINEIDADTPGSDVLEFIELKSFDPGAIAFPSFALDGYVSGAYQALSYYIEDGSFLKLDNINLGYTFPKNVLKNVSKLRVYTSINNVFTLTNYDGIDPEVNFSGGDKGKGEIYFGIDQYNIYPKTRTITFGINVEL